VCIAQHIRIFSLAIHPSTAGRVQNLHIRTVEIRDLVMAENEGKSSKRILFTAATLENVSQSAAPRAAKRLG
jgi:hypothetical protein